MNVEEIQKSEFIDIYRITNGSVLYVNKYKTLDANYGPMYSDEFRKHTKIVRGCKGLRQLKEDYKHYDYRSQNYIIIPAGTFFLNNWAVEPTDVKNYRYELKSSEGLSGYYEGMLDNLKTIEEIMKSYQ